jgi:hypothetical protein
MQILAWRIVQTMASVCKIVTMEVMDANVIHILLEPHVKPILVLARKTPA